MTSWGKNYEDTELTRKETVGYVFSNICVSLLARGQDNSNCYERTLFKLCSIIVPYKTKKVIDFVGSRKKIRREMDKYHIMCCVHISHRRVTHGCSPGGLSLYCRIHSSCLAFLYFLSYDYSKLCCSFTYFPVKFHIHVVSLTPLMSFPFQVKESVCGSLKICWCFADNSS